MKHVVQIITGAMAKKLLHIIMFANYKWVFPKIEVLYTPKWMVYNGKPY